MKFSVYRRCMFYIPVHCKVAKTFLSIWKWSFCVSANFCQIHLRLKFLKNTCDRKDPKKPSLKSIFTNIFRGCGPPVGLIKLFDLRLYWFKGWSYCKMLFFQYMQTECSHMSLILHEIHIFLVCFCLLTFMFLGTGNNDRCSVKKLILKISQISQENTCVEVFS